MAVTDEELKGYFLPFGEVTNSKVVIAKSCGFVTFRTHESAFDAIAKMTGEKRVHKFLSPSMLSSFCISLSICVRLSRMPCPFLTLHRQGRGSKGVCCVYHGEGERPRRCLRLQALQRIFQARHPSILRWWANLRSAKPLCAIELQSTLFFSAFSV